MSGLKLSRGVAGGPARARIVLLGGLVALLGLGAFAGCRSAHTTSAILYIDEQNYNKAVQVIHEGFEYTQDEPDAYYYLGEAHSHLAEEAVANDHYEEALKNYDLAYKAYKRCLEIKPAEWADRVNISLAYNYKARLGQAKVDWDSRYYEQAEGHMRLAYAALPDSLTPIKSIARMKIQMAEAPEFAAQKDTLLGSALELLDQVLAAKPGAYELQLDKAYVLASLGRPDDAARIYNDLLATHGDDTNLLIQIASLAIDKKDYARAADFYVKIVDLFERDTDTTNDGNNITMLVSAGTWYGKPDIGRYDDALAVLDRATNLEAFPTENTMLARLRTFYNYAKHEKELATAEVDPVRKQEFTDKSLSLFRQTIESGLAMTGTFPGNAQAWLYLGMSQVEVGDIAGSEVSNKKYQEIQAGATP